jgi:hypothetical protein
MARSDSLDASLAQHFAWCFALPGAAVDVGERLRWARDEPTEPREPPLAEGFAESQENEGTTARASSLCSGLAAAVADAWLIADAETSMAATKRLLARADRLGTDLLAMDRHPAEAVRLLRLLVRHSSRLTRRQRDRAVAVAELMPVEHPEMVDLLVEVARSADRAMAEALLSEEGAAKLDDDGMLVARLADVIDSGKSYASRAMAIEIVELVESRQAAVAALRRALDVPSFAVRARALHALSTSEPPAVIGEDIVRVLRDLVAHPLPDALGLDEREEDERMLADALVAALAYVQPDEAQEALLDLIDAEHDAVWLDAAWATEALAVAFPETAAVMVDHWLKCARAHERMRALAALRRLPDELAIVRLKVAVADPAPGVREAAKAQWLDRFRKTCPVSVGDLPGAGLLSGAPSERFLSRLAVMHGRVRDARAVMARVLLAEAPDREALVLLLQLVGDDSDSGEPRFGLHDEGWAVTLATRFGALGVEGMCALAARFPEPESFGWMRRLGDLVERGVIAPGSASCVRALAARHVASEESGRVDDSMRVLARLGAPPELADRVLALALDDEFGAADARGLVIAWPDRTIDTRLTSEMAMALAERNWERLGHAAAVALQRGAPAARVIAQRVLEVAEREPDAVDAAVECARHLRTAGVLDDAWAKAALSRPDGLLFAVVARAWRGTESVRPVLEAALGSHARGGASAIQAAIALLHAQPGLSPRDRRLQVLLARSEPPERAELVMAMCACGAPLATFARHLKELLVSADPRVTGPLVGISLWLTSPRARAIMTMAAPKILDFDLRADIEEALGTPPAPYWAES